MQQQKKEKKEKKQEEECEDGFLVKGFCSFIYRDNQCLSLKASRHMRHGF